MSFMSHAKNVRGKLPQSTKMVAGAAASSMLFVSLAAGLAAASANNTATPWEQGNPTFTPPASQPAKQGIITHLFWSNMDNITRRANFLNSLNEAGTEWVRVDIAWAQMQPKTPDTANGGYDMSWAVPRMDQRIRELNERGIKVLLLVYWAPEWSTGTTDKSGVPSNPEDYGKFVEWVTKRYDGTTIPNVKIDAVELWNEPNLDGFLANRSPVTFAQLLKAGYPAAKRSNPNLTVVAGGADQINPRRFSSNWADNTWWESVYTELKKTDPNLTQDYFDAVGIHPYPGFADSPAEFCETGSAQQWYHCDIPNLVNIMKNNGDGNKKLWATEYGWSSHPNTDLSGDGKVDNWNRGVTEQEQANNIINMQTQLAQYTSEDGTPAVEAAFLYTGYNPSTSGVTETDRHQGNFGIMSYDLSVKKPAYYAFKCVASGICASPPPVSSPPVSSPPVSSPPVSSPPVSSPPVSSPPVSSPPVSSPPVSSPPVSSPPVSSPPVSSPPVSSPPVSSPPASSPPASSPPASSPPASSPPVSSPPVSSPPVSSPPASSPPVSPPPVPVKPVPPRKVKVVRASKDRLVVSWVNTNGEVSGGLGVVQSKVLVASTGKKAAGSYMSRTNTGFVFKLKNKGKVGECVVKVRVVNSSGASEWVSASSVTLSKGKGKLKLGGSLGLKG